MPGDGYPPRTSGRASHPPHLYVLFFTEMWERFSYYGMRALLILYLTKHFLLADKPAIGIYASYTSLVFLTPVLGGYLGDRFLGAKRSVIAGGLFIASGHLTLALMEGPAGAGGIYVQGFYFALALIVIGTGFLKANISVLVGRLYGANDIRRDGGFSIFYMGINVGAALGPILCGYLGERYGWSWGFGAAAVGMMLGLVTFTLFARQLVADPLAIMPDRWVGATIYTGAIGAAASCAWVLSVPGAAGLLLLLLAPAIIGYIVYCAIWRMERGDRRRVFAALFLVALCPLFWALFEQAGSSLSLYTDARVDRNVFGLMIPASWFQSVNAIFVIALAPVMAMLWTALGRRNIIPPASAKFGVGLILVGSGFLVLLLGAGRGPADLTPAIFLVLLYLLHSVGELSFSPVGLSEMTRLSKPTMTGLIVGTWFLATAGGNYLAGTIAQFGAAGTVGQASDFLFVYRRIGWLAVSVGILVLALSPLVARLENRAGPLAGS